MAPGPSSPSQGSWAGPAKGRDSHAPRTALRPSQEIRLAMAIQGMELCAVAVVIILFIAVLKQFGILEPMSMEGNVGMGLGSSFGCPVSPSLQA